jgi:NADH dehydrogenase FAD-containing subunit
LAHSNSLGFFPNAPQRVVVLGAGYAGLLAALRLAGRSRRAKVTLVNGSPLFVERIRAHERAAGRALRQRLLAELLRGTDVELVVARATGIDPIAHRIELDGASGVRHLEYDQLIYALGSEARTDSVPGAREHARFLSNEADGARIDRELIGARRVVVVGGGLTGVELAAELAERRPGLAVSLVTQGEVTPGFSELARASALGALTRLGVTVHAHASVHSVEPGRVVLDGTALASDVTVMTTGLRAAPLARLSGLDVAPSGALLVDATLRSVVHRDLWAAGDAAAIVGASRPIRMACATAMPLGAHVADSVARELEGLAPEPFRFGYFVQCASLGRRAGVVQRVSPDDEPTNAFARGRVAARLKEIVCRYTTLSMAIERRFPGTYTWPRSGVVAPTARAALA